MNANWWMSSTVHKERLSHHECNKGFKEKRDRTDSQGRPVGYKNGLKLNIELATAESWPVAQIKARTQTLVEQVMAIFTRHDG